ncbi:MAG TPA: serine protease [Rhodanobacter sp.]
MPFTISEQLTYSTVRIESLLADGSTGTGTGFFFKCLDEAGRQVPVIATNKHVIANAKEGRFHLTLRDDNGNPLVGQHINIGLEKFEERWIAHPDPNVDLCVMPINSLLREADATGRHFFFISLDKSLIPTQHELEELGALEDVIMIGYPNGIWDAINNMPIVRRGVTATHPNINYEGRKEFMIDAACFPGSSGSPVLLFNQGSWATRDGGLVAGTRIKLLGLLYAGPQHTAEGEVRIVNVPTQQRAIAISTIPNNLGLVIKSSRLLELDDVLRSLIAQAAA